MATYRVTASTSELFEQVKTAVQGKHITTLLLSYVILVYLFIFFDSWRWYWALLCKGQVW
jgi:hypothetical protein